ncbi:nucleoside triphosphate pyrophosphohydrolase family protein [Photobacterium sp. GSS17]|uniref:nucleoside triphosphate pyrophosphohydrolase family protein n=1 Tax=Photobacterium sp. GSS17 TaxID=3020715 RepID=UPI002362D2D5|nr:nucleoside triphosphate pyrophosphohydrolase family protein [Photobacterium sp. GSS17]
MKFNPEYVGIYQHFFNSVVEFRKVFGLPIATRMMPHEDDNHTALLVEELTELATAKTKVAQADAVVDSIYVHMGRLVQMNLFDPVQHSWAAYPIKILIEVSDRLGLPLVEIFDEVHQSNMSKVANNEEELKQSVDVLTSKGYEVTTSKIQHQNREYYVIKAAKDSDTLGIKAGKVLKSVGFREPDIKKLLVK